MASPTTHQLYTADMRPDLWELLADPDHPLNSAWPYFLDQDLTQKCFSEHIFDFQGLRKFQSVIVERSSTGQEELVACNRSIPFFWKELNQVKPNEDPGTQPNVLQSLPDGGWDTLVARGIRQYMMSHVEESSTWPWPSPPMITREQKQEYEQDQQACAVVPNALCALSVTVRADRRQMGLAERMIGQMKHIARQEGLRIVVVPLRPTQKSAHPFVQMEEYMNWTQPSTKTAIHQSNDALRLNSFGQVRESTPNLCEEHSPRSKAPLPFDPWLRKHVRIGGKIIKVASQSMVVEAGLDEWTKWTGIDFDSGVKGLKLWETCTDTGVKRPYYQVSLPGGLVPLKVYKYERMAAYIEPNIWVYHGVDQTSQS